MQPSLRHYAVIKRTKLAKWGSVWQIRDRRLENSIQLLVQPSRLIAWPILLARTEELSPTPLRLRSGKVALVYSDNVQLDQLMSKAKQRTRRVRLDPLNGFIERSSKSTKALLASAAFFLLLFVYAISTQVIPPTVVASSSKVISTCQTEPREGSIITTNELHSGSIKISAESFNIDLNRRFGGLTLVTLKRSCDGATFKYRAWKSKSGLALGSRY